MLFLLTHWARSEDIAFTIENVFHTWAPSCIIQSLNVVPQGKYGDKVCRVREFGHIGEGSEREGKCSSTVFLASVFESFLELISCSFLYP